MCKLCKIVVKFKYLCHNIYNMWSKSQLKILPATFIIVAALIVVLTLLLKNKSTVAKTIPLAVIAIVMIVGEIVKISISIINGNFTTWQVPLHYCSMFMPWFFLSCFFTKKSRDTFYALDIAMGIPVMIIFLAYPSSMLRDSTDFLFRSDNFYYYHNFLYHILIFLFIGLLFSLRLYRAKFSDFKFVLIGFYAYVIIATIGSNILQESYANLLYSDYAIMQKVCDYSYVLYLFIMYIIGFVLIGGSFTIVAFIEKRLSTKKQPNSETCEIFSMQ